MARLPQKNDQYPLLTDKIQEVLLRFVRLEPRKLCSEAIIEKCRATRDLRSCGRIVEHSLTSCNHASLCAECSQRCDVCPICRVPITRHGPSLQTRLYEECCEAGMISSKEEEIREKDGQLNADVQRLWSFFDMALEYKLVSLICNYFSDVCMDDRAVSSNAIVAMLLDGTVVKEWCKKTFLHIIHSLRDIYGLGTTQMKSKVGDMEKLATKLLGLCQILESLEGSTLDATSPSALELQQLVEGARRVSQHLDVMCWCARHCFLENVPSSYSNLNEWRAAWRRRKLAANNQSCRRNAWETSVGTLFIEDAMSTVGFGKDNKDYFLWETLELGCLKQATSLASFRRREGAGGQSTMRISAAVYPPESVHAAADMIFLEASADLFLAKKAIFLYYLFDRQWPNQIDEWKPVLHDYVLSLDISRHALLESRLFFLLDETSDLALEEACELLPEVVSRSIHPKVARVLLERQKPQVALDVLNCSNRDGSLGPSGSVDKGEVPSVEDALTAVRVRLGCGLLIEAYLYQRSFWSRVKAQVQKDVTAKSKCVNGVDDRDWMSEMELLVGEISWLCIHRNLVAKMIELPWDEDEEKILLKCLLEQAAIDPCSTAGSLMVMFYIMRGRSREAYLVHKKLCTIEKMFLDRCGDAEKSGIVKSIHAQRAILVEKCVELLPEIQKEQLQTESLDQLLPLSAEGEVLTGRVAEACGSVFPVVQEELHGFANPETPSFKGNNDSLLLSHRWNNYRQPSILHGKPFMTTTGGSNVLSQLDLSTNSAMAPQMEHNEGHLSPILGRKLTYNLENDSTPFANRKPRLVFAQDPKGSTRDQEKIFLFPSGRSSSADTGGLNDRSEPVPSSDNSESYLHEGDNRAFFNERVQKENGSGIAATLFRSSENGAVETREISRNDQTLDLTSGDASRFKPRRHIIHSSSNGKRKAHDELDIWLPEVPAKDIFSTSSLKLSDNELQHGLLPGVDTNNSYIRRKNSLRWKAEDDSLDPPPPSVSGGRIKTAMGRTSSGIRSFRSHAL